MKNSTKSPLLTPEVVAQILAIETKTLANWRASGCMSLPFCKVGSRVRYRASDVDEYIEKNMRQNTGGAS